MADRNRISISLSDVEMARLEAIALQMGIKPTRLAYMAVTEGVPVIHQRHTSMLNNQVLAASFSDDVYKPEKKPTGQFLKSQAKKAKKR